MTLYEQGVEYWRIAKRFHANRQFKAMKPVAVSDMLVLAQSTRSEAVKRRIHSFVALHNGAPPPRTA